jgi:uncharacterized RDD family membrane protein YckC
MSETPHEEPVLFDLPLAPGRADEPGAAAPAPARRVRRAAGERPESLPLFTVEELEGPPPAEAGVESEASRPVPRLRAVATEPEPPARPGAPLGVRLRASAGDLLVLAAVATLAIAGARVLGAPVAAAAAPAVGVFLLAWSFLYFVVSLAFWGQTPGMAWAGVIAHAGEGEPLSFGQTARRWMATWLTWACAGLPGLLALTGRSLADRMSGSRTHTL